jgi:two-component system chemotaxis response regulator CheY
MIPAVPTLVVDDAQTVRAIIAKQLAELGFKEVDQAEDGAAGLECLRHKQYGLVISDWEMPNIGGEQFLKAVRQEANGRNVPIIMVTGRSVRGTSFLAGANAYLQKPFAQADLEKAIRTVMSGG